MVGENNFTLDFPQCPSCGKTETIAKKVAAEYIEKGELPKETFASLEKMVVPLKDPRQATLSVPSVIIHYDICANCGMRYCTRAQKIDAPIKFVQPQPPGPFPRG